MERKPISPVLMIVLKALILPSAVSNRVTHNSYRSSIAVAFSPREKDKG
jgi:hypothetical protein